MGMDKASRRRKRKSCQAKKNRGRVLGAVRHLKNCYLARDVLDRLIAEAPGKHRSLLKVAELEGEFASLYGSHLLEHLNLGQYQEHRFPGGVNGKYDTDLENDMHCSDHSLLSGPDGEIRTLVVLRRSAPRRQYKGVSDVDQLNLALLLHELGRVDHFEQHGPSLDNDVDQGKLELHAHHYACRAIVQNHLPVTMGMYLDFVVNQLRASDAVSFQWAAREFEASPEYERYRKFAGPPPVTEPPGVSAAT